MKIKTAEAIGLQLDWGLAVADGRKPSFVFSEGKLHHIQSELIGGGGWYSSYSHTDPAVCMGLIERHGMALARKTFSLGHFWECKVLDVGSESHHIVAHGKTPAEAVARCVIAMKLGEEFEVPDELGVQS